jgi:hypothetical protein
MIGDVGAVLWTHVIVRAARAIAIVIVIDRRCRAIGASSATTIAALIVIVIAIDIVTMSTHVDTAVIGARMGGVCARVDVVVVVVVVVQRRREA